MGPKVSPLPWILRDTCGRQDRKMQGGLCFQYHVVGSWWQCVASIVGDLPAWQLLVWHAADSLRHVPQKLSKVEP